MKRINESVLGALERPVLAWLADRLPRWELPDHLTSLRAAGALAAAAGYVASRGGLGWLWLSCAGLCANWFGDSLDGTLARRRHIERNRFGFFVDHTSDLFCQVLIFVAVGFSPCAHFGIACLGLIAFLIGFVYTLIGSHSNATMRITYYGFGPTEIRMLLFVGNVLVLTFGINRLSFRLAPFAQYGEVTLFDGVIVLLSVAAMLLIAVLAVREGRVLSAADPRPPEPPSTESNPGDPY